VVRHWPVLGHSPRPEGRQDCVPDRHILRHCYMCRSQAGTTDLYLQLPDLCRNRHCLGRRLRHRTAQAPYVQVPAPNRTSSDVGRHYAATHRHYNHMGTAVRGYGTAHMMYGSEHSSSQWRTKYKLKGHYSHKRVSCATWDPATNQVRWFQVFTKPRTS
jgi:hypothetical protein